MKKLFFVLFVSAILFLFPAKNARALFNCGYGACFIRTVCSGENNYIQDDYVLPELFFETYDGLTENLKCLCRNYGGKLAGIELIPDLDYSVAGIEFFCRKNDGFGNIDIYYLLTHYDYDDYDGGGWLPVIELSCPRACYYHEI